MTKLSPVFLPTVTITPEIVAALREGTLTLRPGQWVRWEGRKGQFLRCVNGVVYVSWLCPGEGFEERTQRMARAIWHGRYRHDMRTIGRAPRSVGNWTLGEFVRDLYRKAA